MTPAEHVGARIRALRQARGLTLRQVAEAARCEPRNVGRVELATYAKGCSGPTLDTLVRIARALDVPVAALVEGL